MLGANMIAQINAVTKLLGTVGAKNVFDADMDGLDMPENVLTGCKSLQTDRTRRLSGSRIDSDVGLQLVVVERGEN